MFYSLSRVLYSLLCLLDTGAAVADGTLVGPSQVTLLVCRYFQQRPVLTDLNWIWVASSPFLWFYFAHNLIT